MFKILALLLNNNIEIDIHINNPNPDPMRGPNTPESRDSGLIE
jgi:hypothetical protein